ncbi:hypothetical protein [Primorskyibacter sp. 2E107]|uniref:hypothetical protein n=1 Tax=Primorskyibacter sp. 2E107 TaxID=3403458 RepID=UPI003AF752CC
MSAIRPHIEWTLGAPVEFVVQDLRRDGDAAFASLMAQRPGGAPINLYNTPGALRGEIDPEYMDGSAVQALLQKSGDTWVAVHHTIGATEAWWHWEEHCPIWHRVIPEACGG